MAKKDVKGNWLDPRGNAVPAQYVKPLDKKRDQVVMRSIRRIQALHAKMQIIKGEIIAGFKAYIEYSHNHSGVSVGGEKGNATLTNFSGNFKIERSVSETIEFSEQILTVKELIDLCLEKWTSDLKGRPIKQLVDKVFQVDKKGRLNIKGLKSLKELNIKDENWKKAMVVLDEAERVTGSKTYFRFYHRSDLEGKFENIPLDFAAVEPIMPKKKGGAL
jgi:Protein of unknown function (DUF3164)